jgi:signal transduction histidine kinase
MFDTKRKSPGWESLRSRLLGYQDNRALSGYVAVVTVAGLILLLTQGRHTPPFSWTFLLWFCFCLGSELLWLETPAGEGTDSMASTFNVAVLYLFGAGLSLWVIGLSVLAATRIFQKKDWTHSFFGLGQMVLTAFAAGTVFRLLAGGAGAVSHFHTVRGIGGLVLSCLVYFFVNTFLVAGAIALERRTPLVSTWKTNYVYRNALLSSGALFALSPMLLVSYLTLGYPGVALFFLPLVIIKKQNREYIELGRATQALIASERMAAKGEMAASVAHEMRNYLAVLSGRTELLKRKIAKLGLTELQRDLDILWTQIERLSTQARGLLDFSHREMKVTAFNLNALCREMVEFLQPQNAFDKVKLEVDLDDGLPEVEGDAGQIHQVVLNLCRNAAEAMEEAGIEEARIWIRTRDDGKGYVRLEVEDNGRGVPDGIKQRIFEPGFTTKDTGHGFGLATCARIAEGHKGRIWVEDRPGGGARFVLTWPIGKAKEANALAA